MGQGSGSPRGFGLFRIINVESAISRNPDIMKHIFDIFNIITSLLMDIYNYDYFCINTSLQLPSKFNENALLVEAV